MEKLAQSHGCVQSHDEHKGSWQDEEVLKKYYNRANNIALTWDGENPVQGWYDKRYETGHYDAVVNNNRVGCFAVNKKVVTNLYRSYNTSLVDRLN